ncbi:MAG: LytTR family DNA-binding domain-containing protein [Bacteroidales bacterium]|nr:LytTR family DNA-binding domain-containing protein [Bacteroidales bacterium]
MKVVVIEDEHLAAKRIIDLIKKYDDSIEVLAKLESVKKSVEWFSKNTSVDLVFMDIQLADGLSFEIFEQSSLQAPVIFTTAFDEYAIRAFKVNSIDYLLKPIDFEELSRALNKYKNNFGSTTNVIPDYSKVEEVLQMLTKQYKSRFVVKVGNHIRPIEVTEIQYFYSLEKSSYLYTNDNKSYALDFSLDQIENLVDPNSFFRISRKFLVNISAIKEVISYSKSRLKLKFKQSTEDNAIVSREKVGAFKDWLE